MGQGRNGGKGYDEAGSEGVIRGMLSCQISWKPSGHLQLVLRGGAAESLWRGSLAGPFPASAGPTAATLLRCHGPGPPSILAAFSDGLVPFTS